MSIEYESITIPTYKQDGMPAIVDGMKGTFIGEFKTDDGTMIEWTTVKEIYKQMALFAAKENKNV